MWLRHPRGSPGKALHGTATGGILGLSRLLLPTKGGTFCLQVTERPTAVIQGSKEDVLSEGSVSQRLGGNGKDSLERRRTPLWVEYTSEDGQTITKRLLRGAHKTVQ